MNKGVITESLRDEQLYWKRKMYRQLILLTIIFTAGMYQLKAQTKGNPQVGVRLGQPLGATARYFFNDADAVEGIAGVYNETFTVTGLYEHHFDLSALTVPGFAWYVGGGAHMGVRKYEGNTRFIAGFDGIIGLDYTFQKIPLNLSLDWKPAVHFSTPSDLASFAVSARYIINRK
ncbi:hypothetical protein F0L74_25905 [Chitinophaga agrisoli]|uniref:Conjugative transposon protein TraO n=1 Tax=Chitinophaga agrisoli TaxID=2607653 RepID=A0A5B2VLN6_9BACT|nr:hypothetical protein [Chitinophaga agrisoli]KAA2239628.1 hypothetical protein F0L74_25905 [Chitinophaga agrisoli]